MVERLAIIQLPDISTQDIFASGVHPYTARFLTAAYMSEAYRFLRDDLQRTLFDQYFMGDLTIEVQTSTRGKKNLENEIREGFSRLRNKIHDFEDIFPERSIPMFKLSDLEFISDSSLEKKRRKSAWTLFTHRGRKRSQETIDKIKAAQKKNWKKSSYKKSFNQGKARLKSDPEYIRKQREAKIKLWKEVRERQKNTGLNPGSSNEIKGFTETTKQRLIESTTNLWTSDDYRQHMIRKTKELWQDPEYRARVLESKRKTNERKKKEKVEQQDQE